MEITVLLSLIGCIQATWVPPQPKTNVWVMLENLTGQDSICLSIASPGNSFSTCLVGVPLDAWPIPLALNHVIPLNNGTVTHTWDLWTIQLPLAQIEPQEIESLDSIQKDFCLFFSYTGRKQTRAWSVNTLNIIYHSASTWCNYTTSSISKSTNQPLALLHGVFLICGDHAWPAIASHTKRGPCSLGRLTILTPNQIMIIDHQNT